VLTLPSAPSGSLVVIPWPAATPRARLTPERSAAGKSDLREVPHLEGVPSAGETRIDTPSPKRIAFCCQPFVAKRWRRKRQLIVNCPDNAALIEEEVRSRPRGPVLDPFWSPARRCVTLQSSALRICIPAVNARPWIMRFCRLTCRSLKLENASVVSRREAPRWDSNSTDRIQEAHECTPRVPVSLLPRNVFRCTVVLIDGVRRSSRRELIVRFTPRGVGTPAWRRT